jgi:hypothetical protein
MTYVTQGTVQIHQKAQDQATTIVINPVPDYRVKHRSEDFAVFMADDGKGSRVFSVSDSYEIRDHDIARVLADAALREMKIEVELEIELETEIRTAPAKKAIVTAIKIPAITKL